MNRTARSLLGAAVVAPFAAALAVSAAPANAAPAAPQAPAAPGPSTAFLYDAAAAAYPITMAIPDPALQTAGRTAETATGAVDRTVGAAPGTSGLRAGAARCKLNPGKTLNYKTGAGLPEAPLPGAGGAVPLDGLPQGDCLGKRGDALRTGARPAALPAAVPADLPGVPSALGFVQTGDVPVSSMLFPARERRATPVPADDVVGQANDTVNKVGANLDRTEEGVGQVVEVLKAKDPAARPADGPLSGSPLSMPDASALGLPALPGLG
ncbi:hypothetical protein ABZ806_12975 [Spirillospora sp. NPDC047418]